ncbi:MAG: hypothetical protein ACN6QH_19340 [Pseudomonas sp.]|uniref:hypothetical protein n=1 Tax=Pseudomonas sp. TaxID=306 RepID=UPI003D141E04
MNFLKNGNFADKKLDEWEPANQGGQYPIPNEGDIHTVTDLNALRLSPGGTIGQWLDVEKVGENNSFLIKAKAQKAGQPRGTPNNPQREASMTNPAEMTTAVDDLAKGSKIPSDAIGHLSATITFYSGGQMAGTYNEPLFFSRLRDWHELEWYVTGPANTAWSHMRVSFMCPPHTTTYPGYIHTDIYVTNLEVHAHS